MLPDLNTMLRNGLSSRRAFLRRSGAAAILAGGASTMLVRSATAAAKTPKRFVPGKAASKEYFMQIEGHENDHVAFLVDALGSDARPKPTFQGLEQATFADFVETAQVLENVGVGAYLGAAPSIDSDEYLAAAGSILTIEARHAGYLNTLLKDPITAPATEFTDNPSFDVPFTAEQVATDAGPFVSSLNGGPALTYDTASSPENDIAILNFALALEYLEADFYTINVAKYYPTGKGK